MSMTSFQKVIWISLDQYPSKSNKAFRWRRIYYSLTQRKKIRSLTMSKPNQRFCCSKRPWFEIFSDVEISQRNHCLLLYFNEEIALSIPGIFLQTTNLVLTYMQNLFFLRNFMKTANVIIKEKTICELPQKTLKFN